VRFHLQSRPLVFALFAAVTVIAGCSPAPTPPPPSAAIALAPIDVTGAGDVQPDATSESSVVIRVTELEVASIPRGPGVFELVLTDSADGGDSASF
jgi:predicted component of type VI protein secretion system